MTLSASSLSSVGVRSSGDWHFDVGRHSEESEPSSVVEEHWPHDIGLSSKACSKDSDKSLSGAESKSVM